MIKKSIIVKHKFRGIHGWQNCPFKAVDFLKTPHHHEFEVTVEIFVDKSDREFEFIRIQHLLEGIIYNLYPNYNEEKDQDEYDKALQMIFPNNKFKSFTAYLENKSCEMIAQDIIECFNKVCPNDITITISEDGHYSGKVEYKND